MARLTNGVSISVTCTSPAAVSGDHCSAEMPLSTCENGSALCLTFSLFHLKENSKISFCFAFFHKKTLLHSVRRWGRVLHVYSGEAAATEQWWKTSGVSLGVGMLNLFALEFELVILCLTPRCSQQVKKCHAFHNCVNMPFGLTFIHLCWVALLELLSGWPLGPNGSGKTSKTKTYKCMQKLHMEIM